MHYHEKSSSNESLSKPEIMKNSDPDDKPLDYEKYPSNLVAYNLNPGFSMHEYLIARAQYEKEKAERYEAFYPRAHLIHNNNTQYDAFKQETMWSQQHADLTQKTQNASQDRNNTNLKQCFLGYLKAFQACDPDSSFIAVIERCIIACDAGTFHSKSLNINNILHLLEVQLNRAVQEQKTVKLIPDPKAKLEDPIQRHTPLAVQRFGSNTFRQSPSLLDMIQFNDYQPSLDLDHRY